MRRIIWLAGLLISLFITITNAVAGNSSDNGSVQRLYVEGNKLVNQKGQKVILKGVSYGWHNWWPRFYNASTVKYFAEEWDANIVRAVMGIEPNGAYLKDRKKALDCIYTVADAAVSAGIYVIIDWHCHHMLLDDAKEFFKATATKYKGIPNVIYEIFNEPEKEKWSDVKAYSEEVIKTIREIDSEALILVGTPHWDQHVDIAADDPIKGYQNIMYTLHFYAKSHKQELRDKADYALKKGLPLFVSECAGMEASGNGPIDHEEWKTWQKWMKKNSISWVAWSVSDKNETCSMIKPEASSHGYWDKEVMKEWAHIVKKSIRK